MAPDSTADQSWSHEGSGRGSPVRPRPGLVVLFSDGHATFQVIAIGALPVVLGRDPGCDVPLDDHRASRRHAEVGIDDDQWAVRDLGSRNGTFVDGDRRRSGWPVELPATLAIGDSICLLLPDVGPLEGGTVEALGAVVVGPRLLPSWRLLERAALDAGTIHLSGETGTGKELAARHFHDAGPRRKGPFIAINCAAIPSSLAERLLFGARRGAYSGADADTEGYLTSASGGTLFLDEVAELSLDIQAKLLRAVETREVLPLGAARARPVELALCSASQGDLRARITAGTFRDDLFFRLCQNEVALPPLRDRREEIPLLVERSLRAFDRAPHASLIEAVLRRPWPGNVRELVNAVGAAARAASGGDDDDARLVRATHLAPSAGVDLVRGTAAPPGDPGPGTDEAILQALRKEQGNVLRASRAAGLHRTQLRRWLASRGIDPKSFGPGSKK